MRGRLDVLTETKNVTTIMNLWNTLTRSRYRHVTKKTFPRSCRVYANEFNLLSVIKTKADSFTNQGSVQVCGKAVKRGGGLGMEIPIVFTFLMALGNTWDLLEQLLDVSNNPAIRTEGRGGSRTFIRRWCTRLLLYFNTNKPHIYFFAEYQLY